MEGMRQEWKNKDAGIEREHERSERVHQDEMQRGKENDKDTVIGDGKLEEKNQHVCR